MYRQFLRTVELRVPVLVKPVTKQFRPVYPTIGFGTFYPAVRLKIKTNDRFELRQKQTSCDLKALLYLFNVVMSQAV